MVGVEGLLEFFAEPLRQDQVALGPDFQLVLEQLLQEFGGDVLVLQTPHFGQKSVIQNAEVRLGQPGRGEHVNNLPLGHEGVGHELAVLFTFLAERYERRSVLLTSNLVFSKWDQIFKDPMTTMAAIDRLVHHATILEFTNGSVRAPKTQERVADQPVAPAIPFGSTASAAPDGATDSVPPKGIAPKR